MTPAHAPQHAPAPAPATAPEPAPAPAIAPKTATTPVLIVVYCSRVELVVWSLLSWGHSHMQVISETLTSISTMTLTPTPPLTQMPTKTFT